MKVKALTTFGGVGVQNRSAGEVFELPEGTDWLKAGLVEPWGWLEVEYKTDYSTYSVQFLRDLCKERNIKPEGRKKADYVTALEAADNG